MPNVTVTSNMNLPNPNPRIDTGPDYANNVFSSLVLVDQHNHSPGYGIAIQPNGLNISSDLTFNSNNATALRSTRYTKQSAPLSSVTDLDCLYSAGTNGDAYWNDNNGNQIQLTASGAVNATTTALVSGSNRASFVANQLVVLSNSSNSTPANIVAGSILLGNNSPGSQYLTLEPPSAMASSFTVTLPSIPASTQLLQIDSSGNITASGIAPSATVPSGVIFEFGGAGPAPAGFLMCDGTSYLRATYPTLFAAIGTAWGSADSTHFNVPDKRGYFTRGVDGGTGNDPDSSSRVALYTGGNTGDNVGSYQPFATQSHTHTAGNYGNTNPGNTIAHADTAGGQTGTVTTSVNSGQISSETRPINTYVNYIIKI